MKDVSGIYMMRSIIKPERFYIGSSEWIYRRFNKHIVLLNKNNHHSLILQNHVSKYGISDLKLIILMVCLPDNLIKYEQIFIEALDPYFNVCKQAGSVRGIKRTVEHCRIISESKKGKKISPETIEKIRISKIGTKLSIETKMKMKGRKAWNKGIKHSDSHREKLSIARRKRVITEEHRKHTSEALKGKPWSVKRMQAQLNKKNNE